MNSERGSRSVRGVHGVHARMNSERRRLRPELMGLADAYLQFCRDLANALVHPVEPHGIRQFPLDRQLGRLRQLARQEPVLIIESLALGTLDGIEPHPGDEATEGCRVDLRLPGLLDDHGNVVPVSVR